MTKKVLEKLTLAVQIAAFGACLWSFGWLVAQMLIFVPGLFAALGVLGLFLVLLTRIDLLERKLTAPSAQNTKSSSDWA